MRTWLVGVLGASLVALTACGGGGQGLRVANDPLLVGSTSIPPRASGQAIDHVIPLQGGCGGPYVMQVIEGALPEGCYLDEAAHAIRGYVLESGAFTFTVQITDSGCTPFQTTTAEFAMDVTIGGLTVVQALQDGVPGMVRPGESAYEPYEGDPRGEYPAIPAVVYGNFSTIDLLVAGGVPPYEAVVFDDPENDFDGPLPSGPIVPEGSTSITGKPQEVGPNGGPFLVTLKVRDAVGTEILFTFYWLIRTPPIVIATESLGDGVCGVAYTETMFIVDGVPPFVHEFVEDGPGLDGDGKSLVYEQVQAPDVGDVVYDPPNAPTAPSAGHFAKITRDKYPNPPSDDAGGTLDYGAHGLVAPPEGIRMNEATGVLSGIPRREGTFRVHYHVKSTLVPNNYGQHNWATFEFAFARSAPVAQDPSTTLGGSFQGAPYSLIPEAEEGQAYDPDGDLPGLQLLAAGGVSKDGWTDDPHVGQSSSIPGDASHQERVGAYTWSMDYTPVPFPGAKDPIPGTTLDTWIGSWRVTNPALLVKQPPQPLSFTVTDEQLPVPNTETQIVRFGVGPDTIIITQSSSSCSSTSTGAVTMNDTSLTVRVLEAGTAVRPPRNLATTDLSHALPSAFGTTDPAVLLKEIDVVRVSVNPTGWWDDIHGMNPRGARPFQHGDSNRYYTYYGVNYIYYYYYGTDSSYYEGYPDVTAVRLPSAPGVVANPTTGVYANGGKLYAFDAKDYFGVFVVRRDSKIYVPIAFKKGTYYSFGDNWTYDWTSSAQRSTLNKLPQMTVSPDGRFAAMKIRRDKTLDQYERANTTDVVIFSLTGERPFSGSSTYKVIGSGASGTSSTGEILYASSLTLTNEYLYYIVGSDWYYGWKPSSYGYDYGSYAYYYTDWYGYYTSWNWHHIYRYGITSTASQGTLLASSDSNWLNTSGNPMQTPFQYFTPFTRNGYNQPEPQLIQDSGHNAAEHGLAPHPFRVSADGLSCAILASPYSTSTYSNTVLQHHVWVDKGGTLTRVSTTARRFPHAGGRGYALRDGPGFYGYTYNYTSSGSKWTYYYTYYWLYCWHYGSWTGPTTAFEISDDGSRVAAVYYDYTGSTGTSGYTDWAIYSEHVAAYEKSGSTWSERAVTSGIFSSSIDWRFGALVFTKDNKGLVFWGGHSSYSPNITTTSTTYYYSRGGWQVGSLYGYDFGQAGKVFGMLNASDGGASGGAWATYTSSSQNAGAGQYGKQSGVIRPIGGFLSQNREFFYVVTNGALQDSQADFPLVAVNVRAVNPTLSTGNNVNGWPDFRGFRVPGMPSRRGFLPSYGTTTSYMGMVYGFGGYQTYFYYDYYYAPGGCQGAGLQVCATDAGWVYFATHYQNYGPKSQTTSYTYFGTSLYTGYYGDQGLYSGHVEVFDANVGGTIYGLTDGLGWSRTGTTSRPITYIEASDDGRQIGFVYRGSQAFNTEGLAFVGNVELDEATGALTSAPFAVSLTSSQRVGAAMTHYLYGSHLFAVYGTGDENQATIYKFTPSAGNPGPAAMTGTSSKARYNVLNAGR